MSFFPYDPPVSDDEPEDDDLLSALRDDHDRAALQTHRSDNDVILPDAEHVEQQMATFLDSLFSANTTASNQQVQQQYITWCQRQFQSAIARQTVGGDLNVAEEQHVARLLSWLQ